MNSQEIEDRVQQARELLRDVPEYYWPLPPGMIEATGYITRHMYESSRVTNAHIIAYARKAMETESGKKLIREIAREEIDQYHFGPEGRKC